MSEELYFDCPQCGKIGLASEMKDHPERPVAMDLGFCFSCGAEINELVGLQAIYETLQSYGEDPDVELQKIDMRAKENGDE